MSRSRERNAAGDEFGPWSFTALRCEGEGTEYTLELTNSEGADEVTFEFADAAFDESGGVKTEFLDAIRSAVFVWEEENTAYRPPAAFGRALALHGKGA